MRVWIFCPPGLEGPTGEGVTREIADIAMAKRDFSPGTAGTPGSQSVRIDMRWNFAIAAASASVATFN